METVVHDLRTRLAVATANVEAFIDRKLEPNEQRLRSVLQALDSIDDLIDRIQPQVSGAYASDPAEFDQVSIHDLVNSTVDGMRDALVDRPIRLQIDNGAGSRAADRMLLANPQRFQSILADVIYTASDYALRGEAIFVDCLRQSGSVNISVGTGRRPDARLLSVCLRPP